MPMDFVHVRAVMERIVIHYPKAMLLFHFVIVPTVLMFAKKSFHLLAIKVRRETLLEFVNYLRLALLQQQRRLRQQLRRPCRLVN